MFHFQTAIISKVLHDLSKSKNDMSPLRICSFEVWAQFFEALTLIENMRNPIYIYEGLCSRPSFGISWPGAKIDAFVKLVYSVMGQPKVLVEADWKTDDWGVSSRQSRCLSLAKCNQVKYGGDTITPGPGKQLVFWCLIWIIFEKNVNIIRDEKLKLCKL